jgi:hypothetical protein
MLPFQRKRDGVHIGLGSQEKALVADLVTQVTTLLETGDAKDPAISRLFPAAYADDAEAAAEFRRFTVDDLTAAKIANAKTVLATLRADRKVPLDAEAEQAWLRTLTDVRLTLASRLGVTNDGYPASTDDRVLGMQSLYEWLGYVQEALVQTLDR